MEKIDIIIACPICAIEGLNTRREHWKHKSQFGDFFSCNGILSIDEKANVHCNSCKKQAPLTEMKFKCPSNRHSFKVASSFGLAEVFSTSAQMVNAAGSEWFISVISHIN